MQKRISYRRSEDTPLIKGKISFSERRITIESGEDSYYVHPPRAHGYIHGDIIGFVVSRKAKDGKMPEASPRKLIKRSEEELIVEATITKKGTKWSLLPVFGSVMIEVGANPRVEDGDLYIAKFVSGRRVELIRRFGNVRDVNIMEELIFFASSVRTKWPSDLIGYIPERPRIADLPESKAFGLVPLSQSLSLKSEIFPKIRINDHDRLDLRSWYTMTIDGADAKDLDDAISIARYEGGDTLLGVHIADVAEYVIEDTPLDREAYLRGTSIYTPGRVIPMLPESLSNDLCSLHPGAPKLVLSILIRIDKDGMVKESFVTEGLIESAHRGVYEDVQSRLQDNLGTQRGSGENTVGVSGEQKNDEQSERVYSPSRLLDTFGHKSIIDTEILNNFSSLYHTLSARRKKEGKILFETTECYFDLDDERNIEGIRKRERGDAHMMIEEFMVLANEEVAKWCVKHKVPFLSRVHEAPSEEKMKEIHDILAADEVGEKNLSISPGMTLEPRHIRSILESATTDSDLYRLSRLLLPKMAKASYREKPVRHYGLALTHYAHFTSPIRRYPDLLLHRMVKKYLHKQSEDKREYEKNMKKWGESLSLKERTAEDVSRSIDSLFMCRYMADKVGEVFAGTISGVTESNVYAELESGIEGSIYLGRTSGPKLILDIARGSLRNTSGKEIYRIGEKISIKIESVDMKTRRIEMSGA